MQRQDYYIVLHPLVYNLMDLMGRIETRFRCYPISRLWM